MTADDFEDVDDAGDADNTENADNTEDDRDAGDDRDDRDDWDGTPNGGASSDAGGPTANDDGASDGEDRLETLEGAVAELTERVDQLERTVAWMARQQAAETGNSACPACNTGGSLRVSRTPAGKKRVECANCGETLN